MQEEQIFPITTPLIVHLTTTKMTRFDAELKETYMRGYGKSLTFSALPHQLCVEN
jgi:hypothetical protein